MRLPVVLTEAGIVGFLSAIERTEVTLIPDEDPAQVYAGVVAYSASNGWRIAIFNDCNEWDYIEWVEANGERVTYEEIDREMPDVARYEPSRQVAEKAYKIPRLTTTRPAEAENLDDARAFDQIREVLGGRRLLRLDGPSSEMLRIVLGGRDTDSVITSERFGVHFGTQKQRKPSRYFRRLGPRMMSELLARASIEAVAKPVVVGLPAGTVPRVDAFPEWSYDARLVWIVPSDDAVKVIVRGSPERRQVPFVQAIPAEGPLALRELPEWAPSLVYREVELAISCPRCGTRSTHYRELADALVCLKCGRSFEHTGCEGEQP